MGDLIGSLLHQGLVRVLSVPAVMTLMLVAIYRWAAPEKWSDDEDTNAH
jgi:hypothetical protein